VNVLFYASYCWKWLTSCRVFVKWLAGKKQLDLADVYFKLYVNCRVNFYRRPQLVHHCSTL